MSPRLPWEVIEGVIDYSSDHAETIHNFSLTCSQLRPRSLSFMLAHFDFKDRSQISDLCDFLQAGPHLQPFVRSITVNPNHFAPVPLLGMLPNLFEIGFTSLPLQALTSASPPIWTLDRSILPGCERFGAHIQTLRLSELHFATYVEFAEVLLAFTNVIHLVCKNVVITEEGRGASLDLIKGRLFAQLQLLTIDIDYFSTPRESYYDTTSVAALLLDGGLAQSTMESLTVGPAYRSRGISQLPGWSRLRSLVLKVWFEPEDITDAIVLLKYFHRPTLKEVTVELRGAHIRSITTVVYRSSGSGLYKELEQTLLKFSEPRIMCFVEGPLRAGRDSFWAGELGKHFPVLFRRGALTVTSETVIPAGHDARTAVLVASPDSKWVASGSVDSTIILWDTINGAIVQQWLAHSYSPVVSLAFSPDGRYLVSSGGDRRAVIWDLTDGSREVTVLEGHADVVTCCAWSPGGDAIATGSRDRTVRLWDTRTFQPLRILEHARPVIELLKFSPNGRWLISACYPCDYHIWDVVSGTLHKSFESPTDVLSQFGVPDAAFDPGSTRLAIITAPNMAKFLDVETGEELFVLDGLANLHGVTFSPDGKLALTIFSHTMMKVWDAHRGVELFSFEGHQEWVTQACFSPCGKYVASASEDRTVRLWRTRDGSSVATLSEQEDWVLYVAFSPDGKTLSSGANDGTVIIRRMCDIIPTDEQEG